MWKKLFYLYLIVCVLFALKITYNYHFSRGEWHTPTPMMYQLLVFEWVMSFFWPIHLILNPHGVWQIISSF